MLTDYFKQRIALDFRSLALLRVFATLIVFADLVCHGTLRPEMVERFPWRLSSEALYPVWWLVVVGSLAAFGLGYKTRWSAAVLFLSYGLLFVAGNPDDARVAVLALLILSVFLPVSRFISLDDAMDRGACPDGQWQSEHRPLVSFASLGVVTWIFCLFVAVAAGFGDAPGFDSTWMRATVAYLIVVSVVPGVTQTVRYVLIAMGGLSALTLGFHALANQVSPVESWTVAALAAVLLPEGGWDRLERNRFFQSRNAVRIYYDEPCGFCRKICYVFASIFALGRVRIATAQSDTAAHVLLRDNDSWVVYDHDDNYALCWAALLLLMRESPIWRPLGWVLTWAGMGVWGKPLYRLIGHSRSLLSKITATLMPYTRYRQTLYSYENLLTIFVCLILIAYYSGLLEATGLHLLTA